MKFSFSKDFKVGFAAGLLAAAVIYFVTTFFPPFFTDGNRGSYAYGQQMGRNLSNGRVNVSLPYVFAGFRDGLSDRNRLNATEKQAGLDVLHKDAAEERKKNPPPAPPVTNQPPQLEGGTKSKMPMSFKVVEVAPNPTDKKTKQIEPPIEPERLDHESADLPRGKSVRFEITFRNVSNSSPPKPQVLTAKVEDLPPEINHLLAMSQKAKAALEANLENPAALFELGRKLKLPFAPGPNAGFTIRFLGLN